MPFSKSISRNICQNISKTLSSKYHQKLLVHGKQFATDALKTASKEWLKKVEAIGDLIGNKIANKITSLKKSTIE